MTVFRPQRQYWFLAAVCLVLIGLFGWDLLHGAEAGSVLFFAVSLGALAWSVRSTFTQVSLGPDQMVVTAPLSRPREIGYGQILSVSEEGRMGKALVIAFHPRLPDGLLDLDRVETVALPALQDQASLYAELVQKAPA